MSAKQALMGPAAFGARRFWVTTTFFVALTLANILLVAMRSQPVSDFACAVASATLWVLAVPPYLSFAYAKTRTFPFLLVISGAYALYFVLPIFSSVPLFRGFSHSAWSSLDETLEYSLLGAATMMLGATVTPRLLINVPTIRHELEWRRAIPVLIVTSAISLAVRVTAYGGVARTFGSIISWICALGQVAAAALLIAWLRGKLTSGQKLYTASLIIVFAVSGLATGMLSNAIFPLVALIFVYGWERKNLPILPLVAIALLLAPFMVVKGRFREDLNRSGEVLGPSSVIHLFTEFVELAATSVESGELTSEDISDANQNRTNMLGMFTLVVGETPREIPYWEGHTYSDLFWHLIPRVVVPDKPAPDIGQEFPRRYEFISYRNYETAVNLPQLVEFYINFGPLGIAIGMFGIGLLYAMADRMFSASSGGAAIGGLIFSGLLNMESNFSLVFGGLPIILTAYYAYIRVLPSENDASPAAVAHG